MNARSAIACAALAVVASGTRAHADDGPFTPLDKAIEKRGTVRTFFVVFDGADGDFSKAFAAALADKRAAKLAEGVVSIRLDTGDEASARKLGVPAEKKSALLTLDGYGVPAAKPELTVPGPDALVRLSKVAAEATAKKKKLEKALESAIAKGEASLKQKDTKSACEQFLAIVAQGPIVPCPAVDKAQKHLDELSEKGLAILSEAMQNATGDTNKATKLVLEASNGYPIPAVLEQAKKVREAIAATVARQQGQG